MKNILSQLLATSRVNTGPLASSPTEGLQGAFIIPSPFNSELAVVASSGLGWDHVSVHVHHENRCPSWEEMVFIKDLFFADGETVMQLHPAKERYVNVHPYTLHLWRPQFQDIPVPPLIYV